MEKINSTKIHPKFLKPSKELLRIQPLMPISKEDRKNLEDDIVKSGIVRDPIKVYTDEDGNLHILGGLNRWKIALENDIQVSVDIYEGTKREYRDLVKDDNLNRRHFTTKQKQALIDDELKMNPKLSNRQIGAKTKSDHKTVGKRREKLESTGEVPQLEVTTGRDGRVRTTKPKRVVQKKSDTPKLGSDIAKIQDSIKIFVVNSPEPKKAVRELKQFLKKLESELS